MRITTKLGNSFQRCRRVSLKKNSSKEEASSSEEKGYTMTRGLYNEANEIFHNGRLAWAL